MRGMFLLELLCEEIPANALPSAREQLASQVSQALAEVGVVPSLLQVFSTCRRLALWMEGLPPATPERVEEVLGPPAAVAFAPDGSVTRAGEGFARAQGVAVEQLRVVETPKGKVVAAQRRTAGEPLPQVLGRILPHLIASLHFPKTMRWGEGEFVFVRPLHRLVALWGEGALNQVVPISLFGIRAGSATLGHRVVHPGEVQLLGIGSLQDYLQRLRAAGVEVDPQQRRQVFEQRAAALASEVGCQVRPDAELVAQHVELVEQPGLVRGALDSAWLALPEVVVATTLRHHQKCLMLEQDGRLAPYFLAVCDRPDDPQGHVRQGNQWVAEARLADAHFFYFQDLKTPLRDLAAKLRHVAFHTQRGSFAEKAERTGALALLMAQSLGLGHLAEPLRMASQLAKADLVSHMVGEFPELQGVMGGLYAKEEGYPEEVWRAIAEQYLPLGQEGAIPQSLTGALLGVADRLDTLAALFSVGEIPSGSKDPYALRRHAFGVVRICGEFPLALPLPDLAAWACQPFGGAGVNELRLFLRERERFFLEWQGVPTPVAEAILAARWGQVAEDWALARALAELWQEPVFVQLATAFKRVRNMVSKEGEGQWAPEVLQEVAEHQLASAVLEAEQALRTHCAQKAWREAWQVLAGLAEPLDRFFVEVLVMCPEPALRQARLGLLARIQALFLQLADLSKLQAAN
ncbi:MAG: glycine--tRNA ligase subunit beta [Thermoanaerobaculum sp.]|nr:glycine--tRNA ligase subunit beta [Thermoanaerobaculum sp.]MDW7966646.1 glycine--tRNA ligase subunit beta [Thermoanaerobaculum sp.]